jgi:hypothetical protein
VASLINRALLREEYCISFRSPSLFYLLVHSRCQGCLFSLDHTQDTHTTVGRTPLDEGSANRRDLYLTKQTLYKRQTSMPPVEFEPAIPASARPQTYALDRAATGIGWNTAYAKRKCWWEEKQMSYSSLVFNFSIHKCEELHIQNYSCACCFVEVRNLVSHWGRYIGWGRNLRYSGILRSVDWLILYRRFGTIHRSHLLRSRNSSWTLKMRPIGCPETSVQN